MLKKIGIINIFILIIFLLTGCWDSRELNSIGIAMVLGIDLEDDQILLTAEIIKPIPSREQFGIEDDKFVTYVQGRGDSIFEAFRDMTLKLDRKVFISHTKVVIFGEEIAKSGLIDYTDILFRDNEQRETAYILVAKGSNAYDIMGTSAGLEEIPANYISKLIENFKYNPKTVKVNLAEDIRNYYETAQQPILGIIEKKEGEGILKKRSGDGEKEYELNVIGAAVFRKDKLIGYLEGKDTKGLNFINNNVERGIITFPTPLSSIDKGSTATPSVNSDYENNTSKQNDASTIKIIKSRTKRDIEVINGKITLKIEVNIKGIIGELEGDLDASTDEGIEELEKASSEKVKKDMEDIFKKAQKDFKVDMFGIGSTIKKRYPKIWDEIKDDWENVFKELDIDLEVKTKIIRTGLINVPIRNVKGK